MGERADAAIHGVTGDGSGRRDASIATWPNVGAAATSVDSHRSGSRLQHESSQTDEGGEGSDAAAIEPLFPAVSADGASDAPARRRGRAPLTPVQRALGLLVRREHSRKELTRKLAARGVEADAAAAAVERLAGEGWQDDTRFAEGLVRGRAGAGYGPLYIRAELATHGLGSDAVVAALATYEGDWVEVARDLLRRRFGEAGPVDLAQRRKAADLLARRGFDGDSIRAASRFDPDD